MKTYKEYREAVAKDPKSYLARLLKHVDTELSRQPFLLLEITDLYSFSLVADEFAEALDNHGWSAETIDSDNPNVTVIFISPTEGLE